MLKFSTFKSGFQELVNELRGFAISITGWLKKVLLSCKWLLLSIIVFLLCISPSFSQDSFTIDIDSVSRGTTITVSISSSFITEKNTVPRLTLIGENGEEKIKLSQSDSLKKSLEFTIPQNLALGEYNAKIDILPDGQPNAKPLKSISVINSKSPNKKLRINSEVGELSPKIESVFPRIIFPNNNGTYSFKVYGSGFSTTGIDNSLIISIKNQDNSFSQVSEIKNTCLPDNTQCKKLHQDKIIAIGTRQLNLVNIQHYYAGEIGIQIKVGEKVSEPPYTITLSRVGYWTPIIWAIVILIVLLAIILTMLRVGNGKTKLLKSFFIDSDTKTYSLSQLQFYLWTLVAILSYLYLFLARSLAQGKPEFIDIPDGLPSIMLLSASTTTFAVGISNTTGNKGSGHINPRFSDFITSGGNVVPERLQFFVWTIIGVIVYLCIVILQNAGQIQSLPTVPQGFLQLSGISSLGYLGGKLARKPGPAISSISKAIYDQDKLRLLISGSNLSKDANFNIEIDKTDTEDGKSKSTINLPREGDFEANIIEAEVNDSSLAKILEIKIPNAETNGYFNNKDNYQLTIYNPDGQFAVWKFDKPSL